MFLPMPFPSVHLAVFCKAVSPGRGAHGLFLMSGLGTWWHDEVVYGDKGPFHDIDNGGVHMHHSTPGVLILILGTFITVGSPPTSC